MSHYEERLERDLADIRRRIERVGAQVDEALERGVHALLTHDLDLAARVVLGDHPINRNVRAIDARCHAFVARHLPSAGHLRFVSSVMRLTVEVERIGDYAVSLARHAEQLEGPPPEVIARDVELMAGQARRMFVQALEAFVEGNAEKARGIKGLAEPIEASFRRVFADLTEIGDQGEMDVRSLFSWVVVFNRLGRVGDQAKNICEETLFAVAGETKRPKVFRILFVDERNDGAAPLAAAYGSKAFAGKAIFDRAGWNAAETVDPRWLEVLKDRGLDTADLAPRALDATPEELSRYHLIVGLNEDPRSRLAEGVPFHSVCLRWSVSDDPETALGELRTLLGELMETLHGPEDE